MEITDIRIRKVEAGGKLKAYEFKFNEKAKYKPPSVFLNTYSGSSFQVINCENFMDFFLQ